MKSTHKASRIRRAKLKQVRRSATASRVASVAPAATAAIPLEPVPAPVVEQAPEHVDSIATAPVQARVQAEPERSGRLQVAEFLDPRDLRDERDESEETEVSVSEPEVSAAAKRSSDSELVVRAVRALRRDRDPEAAARLLESYRSRNPRGVLAEEVLSLQVEAALAAKDARAASYAREYMSRYPEGRYRARAQSALSGRVP